MDGTHLHENACRVLFIRLIVPSQKFSFKYENKGDVLLEFSSVKWVLNEEYSFYSNLVGTLLSQNFVLDNSYFIHFFRRTNDCGDTSH